MPPVPDATSLRMKFDAVIRERGVTVDPLWAKPCEGYNIFVTLTPEVQRPFRDVQQTILELAPDSLYTCPFDTLHITVTWILATPREYSCPKATVWSEIRERCIADFQMVCREITGFTIRYTQVIATDTAIIAVATDDGSMSRLRDALAQTLPIPEETQNAARIIHTTLFRYRAPLLSADSFLDALKDIRLDIPAPITELRLLQENVYPCLEVEEESVATLQPAFPTAAF